MEIDKNLDDILDIIVLKPGEDIADRIPTDGESLLNFELTLAGYYAYLNDLATELKEDLIKNKQLIKNTLNSSDKEKYRWENQYKADLEAACLQDSIRLERCTNLVDSIDKFLKAVAMAISYRKEQLKHNMGA